MNYKKIHDDLIYACLTISPLARIRNRNSDDYRLKNNTVVYTEMHHIIPKKYDGMNEPSNIIEVLPEEHLLLHEIRYKLYGTVGDLRATMFMVNNFKKNALGKTKLKKYSWVRQKYSESNSGENHPMFGRHHSEEAKRKLSEFRKGKFYAKDLYTGEYVGLVHKNNQNIISGKWVHVSTGIQNSNKGHDSNGNNNSRWSGYTDEQIIAHAEHLYNTLGVWNRKAWFEYCERQTPTIPKHYTQQCRFSAFDGTGTMRFQQALELKIGKPIIKKRNIC